MRNGAESSAVRILSGDGTLLDPSPPPPATGRKWLMPLAVVAGVFAVFTVATRPSTPDPAAAAPTLPAPIAAIEAETIDLTAPQLSSNLSAEPTTAPIESARVGGVFRMSSSYVAVGSAGGSAQIWLSGNGTTWREAISLELPDSATSIDHAVHFDERVLALGSVGDGTGVWRSSTPSTWVYHGLVESMGRTRIAGIAAGTELLAIGSATPIEGWMSSNGMDWRWLGSLHDLDEANIYTLAADEEWYFAGGSRCDDDTSCSPAIYRSADGTTWEPTTMPTPPAAGPGTVTDIAAAPTGLLAVGNVGTWPQTEVAVWKSSDGSAWERVGADSPAFATSSVVVEVLDARGGENPAATISTDGIEHTVTNGTELATDGGSMSIKEISDSGIELGIPTSRHPVPLATPTEIVSSPTVSRVAVEGPRIIIGGEMAGEYSHSPAIWTSSDAGATWTRTVSPIVSGGVGDVALAGANVVAVGYSAEFSSGTTTWHAKWDTTATRETAVQKVEAYMDALDHNRTDILAELLPASAPTTADRRFEVPGLAGIEHDWWAADTDDLDRSRVSATLSYLQETSLDITLGACGSSVILGATDRVTVGCDYTVNSALMAIFGLDDASGQVRAFLRNGELDSVSLESAPSTQMWTTLENAIAYDGRSGPVPTELPTGAPLLDGATAQSHIAVATRYVGGLLKPGDTKTAKTSLGTVEWTWIEQPEVDAYAMGAVVWTDLGFVTVGHGGPNGTTPQLSLWNSPDGRDWSPLPVPEGVESLWNLRAFNGGLVGQTWLDTRSGLAIFDGATWTAIELPVAESADYSMVHNMAISGDQLVVITGSWSENAEQIVQAHIIGPDFVAKTVVLPSELPIEEVNVELAASDDGFILAAAGYGGDVSLSVWHSVNGQDWTLLTQSEPLEDAQFAWNLQRHRSQYFVVGDGSEMRCLTTSQGEDCVALAQLWSSPDGVAWSRVRTDGGEPVATYDVGSGPLGLVAVSQELYGSTFPRSVYTSVDGASWELTIDFALLHPTASWWWIDTPAVSEDTIVMVGAATWETGEPRDHPFVIVGRVIAP